MYRIPLTKNLNILIMFINTISGDESDCYFSQTKLLHDYIKVAVQVEIFYFEFLQENSTTYSSDQKMKKIDFWTRATP